MGDDVVNLTIVALRNEKGSYNLWRVGALARRIVALRNEKGSYNEKIDGNRYAYIVALRNEKGSYNLLLRPSTISWDCSTAK